MNPMTALIMLAALCVFVSAMPVKYTNKYDKLNVDNILGNNRLLKNYVDCILDKSKCNSDGEELKRILPDAIQTSCSKCNEAQKAGAKKIVHHLIEKKPEWWKELEAKYDPQGTYRRKYQDEIEKEGFKIPKV